MGDKQDYTIADSGERSEFTSGAARDTETGKGRFDLLPLAELSVLTNDSVYYDILLYRRTNDQAHLYRAFMRIAQEFYGTHVVEQDSRLCMVRGEPQTLEVIAALAVHYAKGAEKYSERNWEKGLPVSRFISSALRHYAHAAAGIADDENHPVAALWNILGAIYTATNYLQLNDFVDFEFVNSLLAKQQDEQNEDVVKTENAE
jgi:hypothetical protein